MTKITPFGGFGLGLRRSHYSDFLDGNVLIDFVEAISENYMVDGGKPLDVLTRVREKHPVALHGVSMSVGSAQRLDRDYLSKLKRLIDRIEPLWVSDHLCWTRTSAHNSHDLLPLPYIEEALEVVCGNIMEAQEALGRPMLFENPSSYCSFPDNEMEEWEFLSEMVHRTGCYLLLDINNIYVSAHNHGFDVMDYVRGLPLDRVRQVHLAGHTPGEILIDTHDRPVCDGVWQLYGEVMPLLGEVATMIERDDAIPPLEDLLDELDQAHALATRARERRAA
ncbi:MAG: DUF692 domain-containing protein [Sphingomonadaceae bacterium]|nr:DUF692 domain-containing protein [Sphingomonadaceae bacterium]